jgi:two-component system, OmpR family, phosphate regulon sensor histidine kinase PhoR
MFSFRQKIFITYLVVFLFFILLLFPFVTSWIKKIVFQAMDARSTEIISYIRDAPNDEALIRRLKDQQSLIFFRSSIISDQRKVLYDSHLQKLLGPKFSEDYIVDHPEVVEAFQEGTGYVEGYSQILKEKFSYFAKSFDFHGKKYVLRIAFPFQYVKEVIEAFKIGFLGLATLILLLFSVLTWFVIHYLTQPIQKIINAVRPYQEGREHILPEIDIGRSNRKDDFNKLALTLNSLSAKIQSHIDNLVKERNEKQTILESLEEGVIAVDTKMNIIYSNHTAMKLLNCDMEILKGMNFSILQQPLSQELLKKCQETRIPLDDTIEIYQEGKKLFLDIVAAPKKDNSGAILVLQDKTAHHKIFEMRRDFIANASHELKTPITVIRGFAEALQDNPDLSREMQLEVTSKIVKSCIRMTTLIKDLLTLSDIDNIPLSRFHLCDLYELCQECVMMLHEAHPSAEVLIHQIKEGISFYADRDLLQLAIMNLIENAAKYSNLPAQITIVLDENDREVIIQISDKGIGVPLADQEHLFDRFYTVDKAHSKKMGGSGLGLAIVKTIVDKHSGTISIKSEIGHGSTFTLTLLKKDMDIS